MAFAFLNMAGMFVLLGSETVAAFQVLIYVGAITVLILFGVMLTPQAPQSYGLFFQGQTPWGALLASLVALPLVVIAFGFREGGQGIEAGGDLEALGTSIFTQFVFPFEIAGVLLLAAIIGAIVLVQREREIPGPPGSESDRGRDR